MRYLSKEIVGSQHHGSLSLNGPFGELARRSLLNRIAQPHKLIYALICLHIMLAFKIVHRRGADRTLHCFALIKHREINDHPIKIVAQYFTSLQWHCEVLHSKRVLSCHGGQPCAMRGMAVRVYSTTATNSHNILRAEAAMVNVVVKRRGAVMRGYTAIDR